MTEQPAIEVKKEEPAVAVPAAAPATAPEQKMSKGERWYNWIVYSGINYWVNLAISLFIADYFRNKPSGSAWIDKRAKSIEGLFSSSKAHEHSVKIMRSVATTGGGSILLVPLKLMEDRKRPLVHWLNKKLGVKQQAPDGHDLTADEIYIEKEQPQQGWLRVVGRRALATAAVAAGGFILNHTIPKDEKTGRNGEDRATDFLVDNANKGIKHLPGGDRLIKSDLAQRWMKLLALDVFYTKLTASVMWFTRGAKKKKMPQEMGEKEAAVPAQSAPPVAAAELQGDAPENNKFQSLAKNDTRAMITDKAPMTHAERVLASEAQPQLQASV